MKDFIPEPISKLAEKIDAVLLASTQWNDQERVLFVPAFAVMLGRFVAYEAGRRERIPEGLALVGRMTDVAASLAAEEFYGRKGNGG